jgi:hypothetical protein
LRDKDRFTAEAAEMNNSLDALQGRVVRLKEIVRQMQSADIAPEDARVLVVKLQEELDQLTTS